MLIAQITDTHIGTDDRSRANDARLEQVVARVAALVPDLVLVTGDLTETGSIDSYRRVAELLAPLGDRVLMTLGNHDRRDAYFAAFPDAPRHDGFAQFADSSGPLRIVMLDTLDEGWETAGLCPRRTEWLDACLSQEPGKPTLIALHHPPARTGIAWIDVNAGAHWSVRLAKVLARHDQVVGLIAGHVHHASTTTFAGRPLSVAGSSAFPLAFDPRPIDPAMPDGRALITAGAPAFAAHLWTGDALITEFLTAGDAPVVARYDETTHGMIAALANEALTHDA